MTDNGKTTIQLPQQPYYSEVMNYFITKRMHQKALEYFNMYFIRLDSHKQDAFYFYLYDEKKKSGYFDLIQVKITTMFKADEEFTIDGVHIPAGKYFLKNCPIYHQTSDITTNDFLFKEPKTINVLNEKIPIELHYYNTRPRIEREYKKEYTEYSAEAKKGVEIFWYLLRKIWANNEENSFYWLRNWIINVINLKRNKTCIYNKSVQGSGKSTLTDFLVEVIGHRYATVDGRKIFDRFNGIILNKILIICEELPVGSKNEWTNINSILKQIITNNRFGIEEKYCPSFDADIFTNLIINTNYDALKNEAGDRRYFISEISKLSKKEMIDFGKKFKFNELISLEKELDTLPLPKVEDAFWTIIYRYLNVENKDDEYKHLQYEVQNAFYSYCIDTYKEFEKTKDPTYYGYSPTKVLKTTRALERQTKEKNYLFFIEQYLKKGLGLQSTFEDKNDAESKSETKYETFNRWGFGYKVRTQSYSDFETMQFERTDHLTLLYKEYLNLPTSNLQSFLSANKTIFEDETYFIPFGKKKATVSFIPFYFLFSQIYNLNILNDEEIEKIVKARIKVERAYEELPPEMKTYKNEKSRNKSKLCFVSDKDKDKNGNYKYEVMNSINDIDIYIIGLMFDEEAKEKYRKIMNIMRETFFDGFTSINEDEDEDKDEDKDEVEVEVEEVKKEVKKENDTKTTKIKDENNPVGYVRELLQDLNINTKKESKDNKKKIKKETNEEDTPKSKKDKKIEDTPTHQKETKKKVEKETNFSTPEPLKHLEETKKKVEKDKINETIIETKNEVQNEDEQQTIDFINGKSLIIYYRRKNNLYYYKKKGFTKPLTYNNKYKNYTDGDGNYFTIKNGKVKYLREDVLSSSSSSDDVQQDTDDDLQPDTNSSSSNVEQDDDYDVGDDFK